MALPPVNLDRAPLETGAIVYAWADPALRKTGDGFVELLTLLKGDQEHGYELWRVRWLKGGQEQPWWVHEVDLLRLPHPHSRLFGHFKGGNHEA